MAPHARGNRPGDTGSHLCVTRRTASLVLGALLAAAVLLPATAQAKGSKLRFDQEAYAPGERAVANAEAQTWPGSGNEPEGGPYWVYLVRGTQPLWFGPFRAMRSASGSWTSDGSSGPTPTACVSLSRSPECGTAGTPCGSVVQSAAPTAASETSSTDTSWSRATGTLTPPSRRVSSPQPPGRSMQHGTPAPRAASWLWRRWSPRPWRALWR